MVNDFSKQLNVSQKEISKEKSRGQTSSKKKLSHLHNYCKNTIKINSLYPPCSSSKSKQNNLCNHLYLFPWSTLSDAMAH